MELSAVFAISPSIPSKQGKYTLQTYEQTPWP
jgi:hypothetical protein